MSPGSRWWRRQSCFLSGSAAFLFVASAALLLGLFTWLEVSPFPKPLQVSPSGCLPDGEGSWSIGVFYGDSPFSLKPIESWNVWNNESAAWPVTNPVVTCATASDAGFPSNFVADPFLFIQGDFLYLFFETKNSVTLQGDIGIAMSKDKGVTWQYLGIALDEEWHLSYPYVFSYQGQIYMMPEGRKKGDLRLYRAVEFPLNWKLEKIILRKPLIDSFLINYQDQFWLFGSDHSSLGATKNGELEIWHSNSLFGHWEPHKQNPVHNMDKSLGARNAGRPFTYNGKLYRPGQDCGNTYGRRVRLFEVKVLTKDEYEEVEVELGVDEPKKGRNAWNGARYHHLDAQKLASDQWVAVMDGDRVPSGDAVLRLVIGFSAFGAAIALAILSGVLLSLIYFNLPSSRCLPYERKRRNLDKLTSPMEGRTKFISCTGRSLLIFFWLLIVTFTCIGAHYVYGGNGAEEAYSVKGHYSQFTLVTMTYDARLWDLKMFVKHYSRCSSVHEILVVWNKGQPPNTTEFDSAVPLRIRVEKRNSLNNRFNVDPLIKTRAVLELDDDIMMPCEDIERGFKVWRKHPEAIVGFYPRLAEGRPIRYRDENYARKQGGYNMILTGAAFIDHKLAFEKYWSEEAKMGREIVDEYFDCEDVFMNYLYINASLARKTVEYVKPSWAINTLKLSGVAISRNTRAHYQIISDCLANFTELYGNLAANKWSFGIRNDGWDA
ncbi:hypothetical protein Cni_G24028 [Canna indica]|uniref:Glucosamine inositolphosphorylceramide transferase 1 n=1 Tax=Canna indica TaxID=4628 RepID=A0AAQ3KX85_9LILI|nr:hypothetical protein Cni_G24028 [Canna indica]